MSKGNTSKRDSGKNATLRAFLDQISPDTPFYALLDHLPGVSFFAKNADLQLMCGNAAFLERLGFQHETEIVGKSDYDLFPKSLADHFRADDQWVIEHAQPKLQIVELFMNADGLPDWYLTNKLPILDREGHVMGVMGTAQNYESDRRIIQPYLRIEPAIQFIRERFREKISVTELAGKVNLSVRQLDRRFREILKMSPQEFVSKLRIKAACERLGRSDESILDIALSLGYYDQSSFTLQFRRQTGTTPLKYRKRHQFS